MDQNENWPKFRGLNTYLNLKYMCERNKTTLNIKMSRLYIILYIYIYILITKTHKEYNSIFFTHTLTVTF